MSDNDRQCVAMEAEIAALKADAAFQATRHAVREALCDHKDHLIAALKAQRDADTALLREIEWVKSEISCGACPMCHGVPEDSISSPPGHTPDCRLAARIKDSP